jgi:peptidoglycan/xylan/chitin deacetylase (PgdA/CDA1 family)
VDCVRDIYSRGHEIASHGYFHKDHDKLNYSQNYGEIEPSVRLLNMIIGEKIKLFAPPSGAFNDDTLSACNALGLKAIMWSRDTIDWRDNDVNLVYSRATQNLKSGEFILMHPMAVTVKALPEILSYIRNVRLNAVTVSYNLGE